MIYSKNKLCVHPIKITCTLKMLGVCARNFSHLPYYIFKSVLFKIGLLCPQILSAQLTLSQPGGTEYARKIILAPPDFQTFLQPWA